MTRAIKVSQPSDRLQKVLEIGDTMALFPILRGWTTEELQALIEDAGEFYEATDKAIDEAWKRLAFQPDNFLGAGQSREIDKARDEKKIMVLSVMSEICSVAIFYLNERGVKTDG